MTWGTITLIAWAIGTALALGLGWAGALPGRGRDYVTDVLLAMCWPLFVVFIAFWLFLDFLIETIVAWADRRAS